MQGPGAQHAAWYRELQCETMLMAVHDNLYKMEEYAVHSSAEAYVGTLGEFCALITHSVIRLHINAAADMLLVYPLVD